MTMKHQVRDHPPLGGGGRLKSAMASHPQGTRAAKLRPHALPTRGAALLVPTLWFSSGVVLSVLGGWKTTAAVGGFLAGCAFRMYLARYFRAKARSKRDHPARSNYM
jgi:membrane associated rhomboid family serine protease